MFFLNKNGAGKLNFIENIEYKFIELLIIDFISSNEENIRQNITFRYNVLKAKALIVENRLKEITALIKLKNPSLLIQLQKLTSNNNKENSKMNKK